MSFQKPLNLAVMIALSLNLAGMPAQCQDASSSTSGSSDSNSTSAGSSSSSGSEGGSAAAGQKNYWGQMVDNQKKAQEDPNKPSDSPSDSSTPASIPTPTAANNSSSSGDPAVSTPEQKPDGDKKDDKDKKAAGDKKDDKDKKSDNDKKDDKDKKVEAKPEPYNPVKEAIFAIQVGKYEDGVTRLKEVLAKQPQNVQAHYVLATALVMMRQYGEAAAQYREVMKLSPASNIGKLAAEGLKKIGHTQ